MKRFHVHLSVTDITQSVVFYSRLFGHPPMVQKPDYAKWMLDDPRINFAISAHGNAAGLDHLGFQVDSADELHTMTDHLQQAGVTVTAQGETTCCYAQSEKGWVHDPQGIAWESFVTTGQSTTYSAEQHASAGACCAPAPSIAPARAPSQLSLQAIAVKSASCCTPSATGASCC